MKAYIFVGCEDRSKLAIALTRIGRFLADDKGLDVHISSNLTVTSP